MAVGFAQRWKGKIATIWGGIWQNGIKSSAILHNSGAPTNGTSGTGKGIAGPGAILIDDTVSGVTGLYQNTNTLASPTWTALTTATGAGTYTGNFDGIVGANTPAAGTFTYVNETPATALTAVGTNRATALALTAAINNVTTATSGTGVVLPTTVAGSIIIVYNNGANAIKVYAPGSTTIDGTAGSTGVTLTNAKAAAFTAVSSTAILSNLLGAVSS